jgi:pimeloyl-ACP methyl ester carboxylesterase
MGTDSTILKAQISHFLDLLPACYEFTFPDAPVLCDPSPGVAEHHPGPYRCWFNTPTNAKVAQAYAWVQTAVLRQGDSFDVVIGFSQGAALAAGMLLHQQIEHPNAPPLFRAAMFICSPLPFSCMPNYGIDIRRYFGVEPVPCLATAGRPNTVPSDLVAEAYFLRNDQELEPDSTDAEPHGTGVSSPGPYYNMFHPSVDNLRITIPTAHVYGRKDAWRRHSMELRGLCSPTDRVEFQHDGGHEVPRTASEEISDIFEELMVRAGLV